MSKVSEFLQNILTAKKQVTQGIDESGKIKEEANSGKWKSVAVSVGSLLLAPVTGDFSVYVSSYFAGSAIGYAFAEQEILGNESKLKSVVLELNKLSGSVQDVIILSSKLLVYPSVLE